MTGRLIVFEGMDCTGKTTIIKELLKNSNHKNYIYSKGIGSDSLVGKFAKIFPSTFTLLIELIFRNLVTIWPNLKKGQIILQDRYDISITSYVPLVRKRYNKIFIWFFKKFIIWPDAIVYLTLPLEEHLNRLKIKGTRYELILAKNPKLIIQRRKEYLKWFREFNGPKIKIDTRKTKLKREIKIIKNFINSLNLVTQKSS